MKRLLLFIGIIFVVAVADILCYWSGSYVIFNTVYVGTFLFLFVCTLFSYCLVSEKIIQACIFAAIAAIQIFINTFLVSTISENIRTFYICRLLGVAFIFLPFLTERIFFHGRTASLPTASYDNPLVLSYSQLLNNRETIKYNIKKLRNAGKAISKGYLSDIITDIPRHSVYKYISRESLPPDYFEIASQTLDDGYIYIVITRSLSPASEMIGIFTDKRYNHVSISFDRKLETIVSYNGGEKIAPPGLNAELLSQLVSKKGSSVLLYRLPAEYDQKNIMLETVRRINSEGSAYNVLGMMLKLPTRPNIMFCSQFAYTVLSKAGLNYFEKTPVHVKPTDFIELDYYRNLEFITEINSDSYC